jgi:hypothetical protein
MCECLTTVLENATKSLEEKHSKDIVSDVSYVNEVFRLDDPSGIDISMPLEYKLQRAKKDGTYAKEIRKTISLFGQFCPFCGKKKKEK